MCLAPVQSSEPSATTPFRPAAVTLPEPDASDVSAPSPKSKNQTQAVLKVLRKQWAVYAARWDKLEPKRKWAALGGLAFAWLVLFALVFVPWSQPPARAAVTVAPPQVSTPQSAQVP